ncbi:hypothetical protein DOTSEDRAFT_22826 [Dothistroma septosporum NZE10]|uniref:Uncharacterized protein n=1 Tax=Dothistroma septosporum (strain NZE10 / CBS 128990) TaxID=675120 RepID=N1PWL8_DOTSN|nr:hypothetical protein DOTSEDRAFT_22826 [Dothistroma septosporum NZE10]
MQTPFPYQPNGRIDTLQQLQKADTVREAAYWLREKGREDDNYDERQWWEESDSDSNVDVRPSPSPVKFGEQPVSSMSSEHDSNHDPEIDAVESSVAKEHALHSSVHWQKHRPKIAYVEHVDCPHPMPAPLKISRRMTVPRKPVPAIRRTSSSRNKSSHRIDKPLPALPDMRVTGEMANGVKILSLTEAQARLKKAKYEAREVEQTRPKEPVDVTAPPKSPARRGTTKRLLDGMSKFTRSAASSSATSTTASSAQQTPAPAQAAATPPTTRPTIVVGNASRVTQWLDFMELPPDQPSPSRPPLPPPITANAHCHCPEHRAERAANYTVPRKPLPSEPRVNPTLTNRSFLHVQLSNFNIQPILEPDDELEPLHSPSVQNEIHKLKERKQITFEPDDGDGQEPIVDTFVRPGHTSISITERVDQDTIVSHRGREERLDGDEQVERAKARWEAYRQGKRRVWM